MSEQILSTEYSEEMQRSYMDYSMSVITSRAVPDIRDGLKPVQRRVLYDMNELHANHDRPTYKSARICGDTMGKYHPHGDSSIYDTLVVMAQDFKRMQPLVHGQGNFGSIEGDSAAAPRYTEAKLEQFTDECMLKDLDTTVPFQPNYDEKLKEPVVLPARVPYFLLNGSEGIAVGMATSTPSHNLGELVDLILAYLKNPEMHTEDMMKYLPGPDFPTGGIIANRKDLVDIYRTGKGKLKLRGKLVFEKKEERSDHDKLVVTEIPYTMIGSGISKFMQEVAALCEAKILPEVTDISNQSDKNGIRIVLELKPNSDIERIENILYKKTSLEDTFGVNMLAIVDGRPEILSLKSVLREYVKFQHELIEKKYKSLLDKEEQKKEIEEGLIKAVDLIDAIIAVLRNVKSQDNAKTALMTGNLTGITIKDTALRKQAEGFHFTERQAQAILDMKLSKLIGLELLDLKRQFVESLKAIKLYRSILSSKDKAEEILADDLKEIKKNFAIPRRTRIEDSREAVFDENAVQEMNCWYLQDKFGYVRMFDEATYERNKEQIDARYVLKCRNTDNILIFTNKGNMYQVRMKNVPLCRFKDKGIPVDNISKYKTSDEDPVLVVSKPDTTGKTFLVVTGQGFVKRVPAEEYDTANKAVQAVKIPDGDGLVAFRMIPDTAKDVVLATKNGFLLRFDMSEIPMQKKAARGVAGIKLSNGDTVSGAYFPGVDAPGETANGTAIDILKLKTAKRGGKGVKPRV